MFLDVLRAIGRPDIALIEQGEEGILLLGEAGEKLTDHYSFFAVFKTPEEYRIVANGKTLGSVSIDNILAPGMLLIFSGRRWHVQEIHDRERVIVVIPAKAGVPPRFGGDPGIIHDRVVERMFEVLESRERPVYMDLTALGLLDEARGNYAQIRFDTGGIVQTADSEFLTQPASEPSKLKHLRLLSARKDIAFMVMSAVSRGHSATRNHRQSIH